MEPIAIIIAGCLAFISPLILAKYAAKDRKRERSEDQLRRKQERTEDFARQDAVAAAVKNAAQQAQESARRLDNQQKLLVSKTDEVAAAAEVTAADTRIALSQIHTLVNSDMTAARQGELDQARSNLILLRRLVTHGSKDENLAIKKTEDRITELENILADRLRQTTENEQS